MKIIRFENMVEKFVPWFIAVCLFTILWAVTGCETPQDSQRMATEYLRTVEYDGCEYVTNGFGNSNTVLVHKGNCKNPIHKCE